MIALLDTDILIAGNEPGEAAPDLAGFEGYLVSCVSWAELEVGLRTAPTLAEHTRRSARLAALKAAHGDGQPFDQGCVDALRKVLDCAVEAGQPAKSNRAGRMIAATALATGSVLLTRNSADYHAFDGLIQVQVR